MAKRVSPPVGQSPILSVVRGERPAVDQVPLDRAEAEVMMDCAAFLRARASRLPEESTLRSDLFETADDYGLLARLKWPSVAQPALVERSQTA